MTALRDTVNNMKKMYREIFIKSSDAIKERIEALRPEGLTGDIFDE